MIISDVLENIRKGHGSHEFIPTGFTRMDSLLDGGFLRKELVVLGGATGAGKSYLAIHLASQAASAGFRVGYFSLEISNELVVARMMGMRAGIKSSHILYGLNDQGNIEYADAQAYVVGLGDLFQTYDDTYELQVIQELISKNKFEYVVIDFIQNVITAKSDEYERLSHVSLHLQRLAKQQDCCVLVLSQLSNIVSSKSVETRPLEYKGSGSIATVADLGFFLAKEDVDMSLVTTAEPYELRLAKNRRGPSNVAIKLTVRWPGGVFNET